MSNNVIIETKNLCKDFAIRQSLLERAGRREKKVLSAVNEVDLEVYKGEALSIVGESGCGKSTLARVLMLIYDDYRGELLFKGENVKGKGKKWIKEDYRRQVQMVFQDPYSCLNPRKTVRNALREVLEVHGTGDSSSRDGLIRDLLEKCGIHEDLIDKFPRELSGGQCQRIGIARALLLQPELLIADEPVSALDVSVQAQVINLLQDLREELDLTLIFISHDLSVVRYISDRVAVMYLGRIVELGETEDLFTNTLHPYTKLLLSSAPKIVTGDEEEAGNAGMAQSDELPNAIDVPSGCRFHTRCPHATEKCRTEVPELRDFGGGHKAACHYAGETDA